MKKLFLLLIIATSVGAQTANVIELEPADAAKVQKAWDALQKAQAEWNIERAKITTKYLEEPCKRVVINASCVRDEFKDGFDLSKDFRFIVPKASAPTSGTIPCCNTITTLPCTFPCVAW